MHKHIQGDCTLQINQNTCGKWPHFTAKRIWSSPLKRPRTPRLQTSQCLWIAIATFWIRPSVHQPVPNAVDICHQLEPGSPEQEPSRLLSPQSSGTTSSCQQLPVQPTCHLHRALRFCDLLSPTILGNMRKSQPGKHAAQQQLSLRHQRGTDHTTIEALSC